MIKEKIIPNNSGQASKIKLKGKKGLVVGLARSGVGAANLLLSLGARVTVTDTKPRDALEENIERLLPSIDIRTGGHPDEIFHQADFIVVSPGVPLDIPALADARRRQIPVIGELELAYQVMPAVCKGTSIPRIIGITGTNGKSTTTTLIDHMLRRSGFRTLMGGNIGNALTEELYQLVMKDQGLPVDYIVAEISSFQLETVRNFRPFISLILNITPDHLDRYKSMREYILAKARIFENQERSDYLILNADDPDLMALYHSGLRTAGSNLKSIRVVFFSRQGKVDGIYIDSEGLLSTILSAPKTAHPRIPGDVAVFPPLAIIPREKIRLRGVHNLENAMAASIAALIAGCSEEAVGHVLEHFPGLEHRMEFVGEKHGITFINDSKGTNVGAVIKSLEGLSRVLLIMGGRDKQGDFTVLRRLIEEKVRTLILLGEAKYKIAKQLEGASETVFVDTLEEAVRVSVSKASGGDVVLLSPGCASFDMFADFQDRGRKFKEAVRSFL